MPLSPRPDQGPPQCMATQQHTHTRLQFSVLHSVQTGPELRPLQPLPGRATAARRALACLSASLLPSVAVLEPAVQRLKRDTDAAPLAGGCVVLEPQITAKNSREIPAGAAADFSLRPAALSCRGRVKIKTRVWREVKRTRNEEKTLFSQLKQLIVSPKNLGSCPILLNLGKKNPL